MKPLAVLSAAAVLALAPAALAQSERATTGERVRPPERGEVGQGHRRENGMGLTPGSGNPSHSDGGNGPGGRY